MDPIIDVQNLGSSGLQVSSIGLGTWAWGDRFLWGYGNNYGYDDIADAFDVYINMGGNFIDTAEFYGYGKSEQFIGDFIKQKKPNLVIASKFMPYPWRLRGQDLIRALKQSLKRLSLNNIDLYQIHWPFPPVSIETWCNTLAECVKEGLIKAVGISNFNVSQLLRAHKTLSKHNISLTSNQVEYHLLNRKIESNGLFQQCKDLGISIIAYSPLAQGLLTGKYTPDNVPKGIRGTRYPQKLLHEIEPLIQRMRDIGREHDGKTPGQVSLNWIICKGAIPIPGAKSGFQAQQNCGSMGWRLSEDEVNVLDRMSSEINNHR